MDIKSYRDLKVWQKAMDLTEEIYLVTKTFPKDELYGLVNQLRRSAASIAANLAEGSSRRSKAEFVRFINISTGSLSELETHILLAQRLNYIASDVSATLLLKADEIGKMLFALQRSLLERAA